MWACEQARLRLQESLLQYSTQCEEQLIADCAAHFNLMSLYNTCFPPALANFQLVSGVYPVTEKYVYY